MEKLRDVEYIRTLAVGLTNHIIWLKTEKGIDMTTEIMDYIKEKLL